VTTLHQAQDAARVALKVGRGLAAFPAGLDEFFHLLADWAGYRSPLARAVVPVRPVRLQGRVRCVKALAHPMWANAGKSL
jgi:hypothetical protein